MRWEKWLSAKNWPVEWPRKNLGRVVTDAGRSDWNRCCSVRETEMDRARKRRG